MCPPMPSFLFFFFNDTATTEIYTLSLHDALPILAALEAALRFGQPEIWNSDQGSQFTSADFGLAEAQRDRKSTRLNSSHQIISYAVFCLKKKKQHYHKSTSSPQSTPHPYCTYSPT